MAQTRVFTTNKRIVYCDNTHCQLSFPDVQLSLIINGLGGRLDSALNNPNWNETETCSQARDLPGLRGRHLHQPQTMSTCNLASRSFS